MEGACTLWNVGLRLQDYTLEDPKIAIYPLHHIYGQDRKMTYVDQIFQ
jgi:hypothetical protein